MLARIKQISARFSLMVFFLLAACGKQEQEIIPKQKTKVIRKKVVSRDSNDPLARTDIDGWKDVRSMRKDHERVVAKNFSPSLVFTEAQAKAAQMRECSNNFN